MSVSTIYKGGDCRFFAKTGNAVKIYDKPKSRSTFVFSRPPHIVGKMSVVGAKEGNGPFGEYFDEVLSDDKMKQKSFETAEIKMLERVVLGAIDNAKIDLNDINAMIAGDLLNQVTSSNYVARNLRIPFIGMYNACSTMTECLAIGAALIDAGHLENAVCATVSHFATAERQYRYPLEYGCQRPPYAQWTVTGAGGVVLSCDGIGPCITHATIGRVVDFGTTDLNNMGASMAPAAVETLTTLFNDTDTSLDDYDLIVTGDLGKLGSDIFRDLMREKGVKLGQKYFDCGGVIYNLEQNCYQGGSGAGCSASLFASFIMSKISAGEYNRVIYLATGALMSPQSCYQGESIPAISHAVVIER